jgi:hypothetical protein
LQPVGFEFVRPNYRRQAASLSYSNKKSCRKLVENTAPLPHNSVELNSMEPMRELGRMMVFAGAALAAVGALVWLAARPGGLPLRLGRLPGDIAVQGKHGSFYFPVVTCILLSVALTLILWLVQWLKR